MADEHEGQGAVPRRDGSSPASAVIAGSVREEYEWIARHYPGFVLVRQALIDVDGRPGDVFVLRSEAGDEREVYFDISAFFGKGKQPGPPCPYCGFPLRTPRAKQCRNCGTDWHDAANVIRRQDSSEGKGTG